MSQFSYKGKVYEYASGQEFCFDCGSRFEATGEPAKLGGHITVTCPNPECNRGSWAEPVGD